MSEGAIITGRTAGGRALFWALTILCLLIIYAPAVYLLLASLNPGLQLGLVPPDRFSLAWYTALPGDRRLLAASEESALVGAVVAVLAVPLGLSAALAYRGLTWGRSAFLLFVLSAMFVPGTIEGLGLSVVLKLIAVRPSWASVAAGHLLWALPFCFTVSLVGLSAVRPNAVAAARDLGATRWQAFATVTLPMMRGSLASSFAFAFLLSLNEYARAYFLVGRQNTLPLHMFGAMNSGASPTVYAFAGAVLAASFAIMALAMARSVRT